MDSGHERSNNSGTKHMLVKTKFKSAEQSSVVIKEYEALVKTRLPIYLKLCIAYLNNMIYGEYVDNWQNIFQIEPEIYICYLAPLPHETVVLALIQEQLYVIFLR